MMQITTVLLLCLLLRSSALNFQIFKDFNFKGLIFDYESDPLPSFGNESSCENVKFYARGLAGSVWTDRCLMAYEQLNCGGESVKLIPEEEILSRLNKPIYSFHLCNETIGGENIRANLYAGNSLVAEYFEICGCQDIPTQVSSTFTRMDNFGNCITVYSGDNCDGQAQEIEAGRNVISDGLDQLPFYIRSFQACGFQPSCIKLTSKIYKFILDFDEPDPDSLHEVELAAKTVFTNNGSATISQVYSKSKTILETFTVKKTKSISTISTVEKGYSTETNGKVEESYSYTSSIEKAYTFPTEEYTQEEENTFSIKQTIQVPPCTQYEVNSMITVAENQVIKYWVYTKISGEASGKPVPLSTIKPWIGDMEFVEEIDEFTGIFRAQEEVLAKLGVETKITGEGSNIQGCIIQADKELDDELMFKKHF